MTRMMLVLMLYFLIVAHKAFSVFIHFDGIGEKREPRHDKTNKMSVRPAKTQISLGIRPVWSESSLCAQWVAKDPSFLHADSEDSDKTGRMPRLIWVFAGCSLILLVLSRRGSCAEHHELNSVEHNNFNEVGRGNSRNNNCKYNPFTNLGILP